MDGPFEGDVHMVRSTLLIPTNEESTKQHSIQ